MGSDQAAASNADEANPISHNEPNAGDDSSSTSSSASSTSDSSSSSSSSSSEKPTPPFPVPTPTRSNKSKTKKNRGYTNDAQNENAAPPSWDSMNGDQIRQNARELLQASPERNGTNDNSSNRYQSYHDAPAMSSMHRSSSQFQSGESFPSSGGYPHNSHENSEYFDASDNLSFQSVASMALSCMAHCLTEGYRAASTYYSGESTQHASVSRSGNYSHNYQNVGSYYSDNNNRKPGKDVSVARNAVDHNYSGYSGSYQNISASKIALPQSTIVKEVGEKIKQKVQAVKHSEVLVSTEPKGEYTSVALPSTYQGGSTIDC